MTFEYLFNCNNYIFTVWLLWKSYYAENEMYMTYFGFSNL